MSRIKYITHPNYSNIQISIEEIWMPVLNHEQAYAASTHGRIKSIARMRNSRKGRSYMTEERILSPFVNRGIYHMVLIHDATRNPGQKPKGRYIHQLVLEAFIGPAPDGLIACHNDGDGLNNKLENLRWDTHGSNNGEDKRKHGTAIIGERNYKAKVTEDQVRQIRRLYATGKYSQEKLGRMYDLHQAVVSSIVRRETWKHVT